MAVLTRTWWGKKFISALEACIDEGRLRRGKSYNSPYRILRFDIEDGVVKARVRGNINPYFGVLKEPKYRVSIQLKTIKKPTWRKIIKQIANNPAWLMKLFMREMPDDMEEVFVALKTHLLPGSSEDILSYCSCPDWANPCKHIAGVYFRVAELLDQNPFVLFELRGMKFDDLIRDLSSTPIGRALSKELSKEQDRFILPEPVLTRYPVPKKARSPSKKMKCTYREFWQGQPTQKPKASKANISALLVKKEGDYPPFWPHERSFVHTMEEIYDYVVKKSNNPSSGRGI